MMRVGLLLLGCSAANAHGRLTVPRPRPPLWAEPDMLGHTSATATYRWNEPVFTLNGPISHNGHSYRADSYRCHDFKAETPQTTVTAGAGLRLAWTLEAAHPGDWCGSPVLCLPHLTPRLTYSDPIPRAQLSVHLVRRRGAPTERKPVHPQPLQTLKLR